MPLAWGYAIFDTVMGVPMACGAVLGGVLFRSGYALPFVVVIVIALGLLVLPAVGAHGRGATRSHGGLGSGEGTD
jgi:predicted MFS family arabinose efflux permease